MGLDWYSLSPPPNQYNSPINNLQSTLLFFACHTQQTNASVLLFHIYKAIDISLLLVSPYLLPWPISVPHHHNIDISLKNMPTIMHFISKLISVTSIPPVPRHHFLFTESSLPNFPYPTHSQDLGGNVVDLAPVVAQVLYLGLMKNDNPWFHSQISPVAPWLESYKHFQRITERVL